jgi:hypothetical protein
MRKLIVIAAISLVSATANAGPSRSLSLASTEPTQTAPDQAKTERKADVPPVAVERPKLVVPQDQAKPSVAADKPEKSAKPKARHISTEARVIYELHRHGIYW